MTDRSVPSLLQERADQQPDSTAYTYIDYGSDPKGFADSLTWSQVYSRACIIAEELKLCGLPGDRVAVLAPQGLEYVLAFLGALQAGFIAVRCQLHSMAFTMTAFLRCCRIPSR